MTRPLLSHTSSIAPTGRWVGVATRQPRCSSRVSSQPTSAAAAVPVPAARWPQPTFVDLGHRRLVLRARRHRRREHRCRNRAGWRPRAQPGGCDRRIPTWNGARAPSTTRTPRLRLRRQTEPTRTPMRQLSRAPRPSAVIRPARRFHPGVHTTVAAFTNTGTVTLDADGDSSAVFVFQVGAAFSSAAASKVVLTDGALANNVFWQVAGAVSLGAGAKLVGTFLGAGAITFGDGASIKGRALTPGTVAVTNSPFTEPIDDLTAPVVTIDGGAGPLDQRHDTTDLRNDRRARRQEGHPHRRAGRRLTSAVGAGWRLDHQHWCVDPRTSRRCRIHHRCVAERRHRDAGPHRRHHGPSRVDRRWRHRSDQATPHPRSRAPPTSLRTPPSVSPWQVRR